MYDITPLGGDACLSDTSAACTYWHLKCRAMAGELLPEPELRFVGFEERPPSRGGWQNAATNLELLYRANHDRELSAEDAATLHALMSIENVELPAAHALAFLGG